MIKRAGSQGGQVIIEFAFMLPIIVLILLGIIEFGIVFYNMAMITNASREGARAGIAFRTQGNPAVYSPLTEAEILAVVTNYLQTRLINFAGTTNIAIDPNPTVGTSPKYGGDGYVNVVVRYTHKFLAIPGFLGLGNTIALAGQTIMRLE